MQRVRRSALVPTRSLLVAVLKVTSEVLPGQPAVHGTKEVMTYVSVQVGQPGVVTTKPGPKSMLIKSSCTLAVAVPLGQLRPKSTGGIMRPIVHRRLESQICWPVRRASLAVVGVVKYPAHVADRKHDNGGGQRSHGNGHEAEQQFAMHITRQARKPANLACRLL